MQDTPIKTGAGGKGFEFRFDSFRKEPQALPYIPLEKELDQQIKVLNILTLHRRASERGEISVNNLI